MLTKLFQNMLNQLYTAFRRPLGLIDSSGFVVSHPTIPFMVKNVDEVFRLYISPDRVFTHDGYSFLGAGLKGRPSFIAFVEGEDEEAERLVRILCISLSGLSELYDERFDRANFIKNVLLDNVLPGDVLARARELRLSHDAQHVVFLIRMEGAEDFSSLDIVANIFPEKDRDFVINIDDRDAVLVKEVHRGVTAGELLKIAQSIVDMLNSEALLRVVVGIGPVAETIKSLSRSFKGAQVALEVGKVFDNERTIVNYENLGIARLIYQLPTTLCELFLSEVFKKEGLAALDGETISTIQKFFENNLNVSETARQLYVHRNTLVYRLDKIEKLTGLDLRIFDHAIIFKVAMMVNKYLVSNPVKM